MVQWLRLRAPNAGRLGSIPGQGTRSHMPQPRPNTAKQNFFFKFHSPGPALSHPASSSTFSLQQVGDPVAQCHFLSGCYVFGLFSCEPCSAISSVTQSCPMLCDPMGCSTPGILSITNSRSSLKLMSIKAVKPSNHLILCRLLLLPLSIFPSIRIFSNESVSHIR